jgi:CheY-like chemotaxis protein
MERPYVLAVDDDPHSLAALRRVLRECELNVETVSDPLEALRTTLRRAPDLIVLDISMPTMSAMRFGAACAAWSGGVRRSASRNDVLERARDQIHMAHGTLAQIAEAGGTLALPRAGRDARTPQGGGDASTPRRRAGRRGPRRAAGGFL